MFFSLNNLTYLYRYLMSEHFFNYRIDIRHIHQNKGEIWGRIDSTTRWHVSPLLGIEKKNASSRDADEISTWMQATPLTRYLILEVVFEEDSCNKALHCFKHPLLRCTFHAKYSEIQDSSDVVAKEIRVTAARATFTRHVANRIYSTRKKQKREKNINCLIMYLTEMACRP